MRRASLIGVAAAAALVLAACSSGDSTDSTATETVEETTTETVEEGTEEAAGGIEPLNVHIVAAKTGIISPFDIQVSHSRWPWRRSTQPVASAVSK